jgi:hypothetical protein
MDADGLITCVGDHLGHFFLVSALLLGGFAFSLTR